MQERPLVFSLGPMVLLESLLSQYLFTRFPNLLLNISTGGNGGRRTVQKSIRTPDQMSDGKFPRCHTMVRA